ncbi:MAG: UDP-N-acetylglucosamine 2-epimerase, partial [Enterovibrio sp.]
LNVHLIEPVGYFEMVWLLDHCNLVLTDIGGVQKEAFFFGKACVTMRDQTEWVELIEVGANELVGAATDKIVEAARRNVGRKVQDTQNLYGGGKSAEKIVKHLNK